MRHVGHVQQAGFGHGQDFDGGLAHVHRVVGDVDVQAAELERVLEVALAQRAPHAANVATLLHEGTDGIQAGPRSLRCHRRAQFALERLGNFQAAAVGVGLAVRGCGAPQFVVDLAAQRVQITLQLGNTALEMAGRQPLLFPTGGADFLGQKRAGYGHGQERLRWARILARPQALVPRGAGRSHRTRRPVADRRISGRDGASGRRRTAPAARTAGPCPIRRASGCSPPCRRHRLRA